VLQAQNPNRFGLGQGRLKKNLEKQWKQKRNEENKGHRQKLVMRANRPRWAAKGLSSDPGIMGYNWDKLSEQRQKTLWQRKLKLVNKAGKGGTNSCNSQTTVPGRWLGSQQQTGVRLTCPGRLGCCSPACQNRATVTSIRQSGQMQVVERQTQIWYPPCGGNHTT